MMIIYKRNINKKLLLVRVLFIFLLLLSSYAYIKAFSKMGYVLGVIWFFLSFIFLTSLTVHSTSFEIKRYYFFGLLVFKWKLEKGQTEYFALVNRFVKVPLPLSETFLDLILIFLTNKGNVKFITVWIDKKYKSRTVTTRLTDQEYDLLNKILNSTSKVGTTL